MEREAYILYTNHRGEKSWRHIDNLSVYFGTTEWHRDPQYLLLARDLDKNENRSFAMKNIHEWFWPHPTNPRPA